MKSQLKHTPGLWHISSFKFKIALPENFTTMLANRHRCDSDPVVLPRHGKALPSAGSRIAESPFLRIRDLNVIAVGFRVLAKLAGKKADAFSAIGALRR